MGVACGLFVGAVVVVALYRGAARTVAPPPAPSSDGSLFGELPPSSLNLPVEYELERVLALLEEVVPTAVGDLAEGHPHPAGGGLRYAYEVRRGPLELELRGDTAHLTAVLHYQGRASYALPVLGEVRASCVEEGGRRPRALLEISSPLELTSDWALRSRTRIERLEPYGPGSGDRCRLPALQLDLTDVLMATVGRALEGVPARVDSLVASVDLRTPAERQWGLLGEPVSLAPDVWLALGPVGVERARLQGTGAGGATLRAEVALSARPRLVLGARPAAASDSLPPVGEASSADGLHLLLEGRMEYSTLSAMVERELAGRSFHAAGRAVEVREVELGGMGDGRLSMRLDVDGALRGRLFLVGTPTYDPVHDEILVPDLDFHVETRNLLVRAAAWILRAGFPEHVRRHARWPVGETLERARAFAGDRLDHPLPGGARIEGELGSAELAQVGAARDALVVRMLVEGRARLVLDRE